MARISIDSLFEGSHRAVSVARALLGAVLLYDLWIRSDAALEIIVLSSSQSPWNSVLSASYSWLSAHGLTAPLFVAYALSCFLFGIGYRPRITTALTTVGFFLISTAMRASGGSQEALIASALLIFLGMSHLERPGKNDRVKSQGFFVAFIVLTSVYWIGLVWKAYGADWINGYAVYWAAQSMNYSRPWFEEFVLGLPVPAIRAISYGALAIELAIPILLFFRKTRKSGVFLLIALHSLFWLALKVHVFTPTMIIFGVLLYPAADGTEPIDPAEDSSLWFGRHYFRALAGGLVALNLCIACIAVFDPMPRFTAWMVTALSPSPLMTRWRMFAPRAGRVTEWILVKAQCKDGSSHLLENGTASSRQSNYFWEQVFRLAKSDPYPERNEIFLHSLYWNKAGQSCGTPSNVADVELGFNRTYPRPMSQRGISSQTRYVMTYRWDRSPRPQ